MEQRDFDRFEQYMSIIGEIASVDVTDNKIIVYWNVLKKYPADQVFAGFERIIEKPRLLKFPVPGDIIAQFSLDIETQALQAWDKVKKGIHKAGYMNSVKFDDPVIHNAIKVVFGGWKKLCDAKEADEKFYRPQFLKAYAMFAQAKQQGKLEPIEYLPGEAELHNSARGLKYDPPVEIGAPERIAIENKKQALPEGGE